MILAEVNWSDLWEVFSLTNHNTRVVILSVALLGMVSGLVGSFLLLRKRSLMGDALAHATLPGVGVAFAIMVTMGFSGKAIGGLWLGAIIAGVLGVATMLLIVRTTRLTDDVAMGLVLSIFFGAGIAILSCVTRLPQGSAAGLEDFIYGKPSSILGNDLIIILVTSITCGVLCIVLLKEFTLLCFDENFGRSQGWPMLLLDILLLGLVTIVTVTGLQAVGIILMIALFIIPAAAARFWATSLKVMMLLSAILGLISGWIGGALSALFYDLPAGAVIVLVAGVIFLFSMFLAPARGIIPRIYRRRQLNQKVGEQHLLRAIYELLEDEAREDEDLAKEVKRVRNQPIPYPAVLAKRTWKREELNHLRRTAKCRGYLESIDGDKFRLTEEGFGQASRITHNHRLWEIYLVTHADIAPSHVDRDADMIEHVLDADLVNRLEEELKEQYEWIPSSLHKITNPPDEKGEQV